MSDEDELEVISMQWKKQYSRMFVRRYEEGFNDGWDNAARIYGKELAALQAKLAEIEARQQHDLDDLSAWCNLQMQERGL